MDMHIEWWGETINKPGICYRRAILEGSTLQQQVEFVQRMYRSASDALPSWIRNVEGASNPALSAVFGVASHVIRVRARIDGRMKIFYIIDKDYWPKLEQARESFIALMKRASKAGLNVGKYNFCQTDDDFERMASWNLFQICKDILELISQKSVIIPSIVQEIFPTGSKKTFVRHQRGECLSAVYHDTDHAYGQVASKIGCDARIYRVRDREPLNYEACGYQLEIFDDLRIIKSGDNRTFQFFMDELNRKELKPIRLPLMGVALTQINGRGKFVSVVKRKDGVIRSFPLHMGLPKEGWLVDTAMLSVRFIYEAMMCEYVLSHGSVRMALTDGLIIEGSLAHRPYLLDVLGLDTTIKDEGKAMILAPNCYRIGDRTTLNYFENALQFGRIESSDDDEDDFPAEWRVVAIPAVMGWTAAETAAVFDWVQNQHKIASAVDGLLKPMPSWLADIQERKALLSGEK